MYTCIIPSTNNWLKKQQQKNVTFNASITVKLRGKVDGKKRKKTKKKQKLREKNNTSFFFAYDKINKY